MNRFWIALVALLLAGSEAEAQEIQRLHVIVDNSSSMRGLTSDGEVKASVARRIARDTLSSAPTAQTSLSSFGDSGAHSCRDHRMIVPPGQSNARTAAESWLATSSPPLTRGSSPLAYSLREAANAIGQGPATVVIITDGESTCENVCEALSGLASSQPNINFYFHMVGAAQPPQCTLGDGEEAARPTQPIASGTPAEISPPPMNRPAHAVRIADRSPCLWLYPATVFACLFALVFAFFMQRVPSVANIVVDATDPRSVALQGPHSENKRSECIEALKVATANAWFYAPRLLTTNLIALVPAILLCALTIACADDAITLERFFTTLWLTLFHMADIGSFDFVSVFFGDPQFNFGLAHPLTWLLLLFRITVGVLFIDIVATLLATLALTLAAPAIPVRIVKMCRVRQRFSQWDQGRLWLRQLAILWDHKTNISPQ